MSYDPDTAMQKALGTDEQFKNLRDSLCVNRHSASPALFLEALNTLYKHGYLRGSIDALTQIEVPHGHTSDGNQSAR